MNSGTRENRLPKTARLLVALIGLAFVAFAPAPASAAGTGSISGTITDGSDDPVGGVCARAYVAADNGLNYVGDGTTDSDGNYTIEELDTGDYRVRFTPCGGNVLREWFDDAETFAEATWIPVTDGADTPDIDAELATGGSISGRVLSPPGGPDSGICVDVVDPENSEWGFTQSTSGGDYMVGGLETGEYLVGFNTCDFDGNTAREYYPDKASRSEATRVAVTAGSDTSGIDAQLEKGASVSGRITGALPVPGPPFFLMPCTAEVTAFNVDEEQVDTVTFDLGMMGGSLNKSYVLNQLKPGSDFVLRGGYTCDGSPVDPGPSATFAEYYSDQSSFEEASPISVGTGTALKGLDIVLGEPDPALAAPDTVIDSGPSGTITTTEATFGFSSSDPGVTAGFECKLDSGEFNDCSSPQTFSSLSEGAHTVSIRALHAVAGNEDQSPATRSFTVDTSKPAKPKAKIGKVTAKGPARVKLGKKATYRVRITNSGDARAKNVALKVRGKGVSLSRTVGSIAHDSTTILRVKVKPRSAGKGKLTFKVTSSNAGGKSTERRINVVRTRR